MKIGTPLSPNATRVMLLGSGELGKEVIIALQRLGVEGSGRIEPQQRQVSQADDRLNSFGVDRGQHAVKRKRVPVDIRNDGDLH